MWYVPEGCPYEYSQLNRMKRGYMQYFTAVNMR